MADDTFAALRRVVRVGIDLLDAMDVYAWGLDRAFAVIRAAYEPGPHRMSGGSGAVLAAVGRSKALERRRESGAGVRDCDGMVNRLVGGGVS